MRSGTQGPGDRTCEGAAKCPEALISLWRGGRGLSQTHVASTCEAKLPASRWTSPGRGCHTPKWNVCDGGYNNC